MSTEIRLQKYLALCGVASRRKAEEFIAAGKVSVDGRTVRAMGEKINPQTQKVTVDGKQIAPETEKTYILLNKPKGYVTTLADPQGRPIVTDLIKDVETRIFPVGRLDFDTEGALLLTNDGELAQKMQHPSFEVTKTYEARIKGVPSWEKLKNLERGILLEGKMTSPAKLKILGKQTQSALVRITIHEGRKHQVKKMFSAIGHPVTSLKRVAYGNLRLQNLPRGRYRLLNKQDLKKIFQNIPLQIKK